VGLRQPKQKCPLLHAATDHLAKRYNAVIRVYDATGNVIETHEHKGDFKEW